ncbi:hypothetical protein C8J57DRAFT_1538088 [Mycena rebaudengoi]|nr:hypothetical protein C8J57DRAFT_1538088 [Mycena rebaudengoi]
MVSSQYQELVGASGEKNLCIWIPTHSSTKSTCPGYFDNSVAGSIPSGMQIFEALVKYGRTYLRSPQPISSPRTSTGWFQPEVEYLYNLVIPANADPAPFKAKPFKARLSVLTFGYISPDNEPDFMRIVTRLHTQFDYEH